MKYMITPLIKLPSAAVPSIMKYTISPNIAISAAGEINNFTPMTKVQIKNIILGSHLSHFAFALMKMKGKAMPIRKTIENTIFFIPIP
ncbi:MAG: hypothetical protein WB217_04095 [Mesobacillus sp.]|uniref:hypothetical protein n=1 Tax=Mesobacillus sp. TaxID=2675271 RepID=UPI003C43947B